MRTSLFVVILVVFVGLSAWLLLGAPLPETPGPEPVACTMDAKICPDGSAVGRTGPNCEFAPCPEVPEVVVEDLIVIDAPLPGSTVTNPVKVTGKARGAWFFEGSFPVVVVNWDGLIIGEGVATAEGEWMTEDFVPFSGTIFYTLAPGTPYDRGALIFKKDNPSGLPEHDDAREVPIFFDGTADAEMEYPIPDEPAVRPSPPAGDIACTMDAKRCPDGSFVGRVPPSCAFAPCPVLEVQ